MHFSKKKFPKSLSVQKLLVPLQPQISKVVFAQMAESVDALVSNTSGATRAGSTPALGTLFLKDNDLSAKLNELSFFCLLRPTMCRTGVSLLKQILTFVTR